MLFVLDWTTFKEVAFREDSELVREKFYYFEDPSEFVLYYSDKLWKFKTTVSKNRWVEANRYGEEENKKTLQTFRETYLVNKALPILKVEKDIQIL